MTTLQQLADRIEIGELVSRLGLWLDSGAPDDAVAILADDVTAKTPGGRAEGRAAVVAQARRNHRVQTQHVITNVIVDLDGDRADVGANLIATFAPAPGSAAVGSRLGERYRFEVVRTPDGWRIAYVETILRFAEGERLKPATAAA
jgi:hypothetical protein